MKNTATSQLSAREHHLIGRASAARALRAQEHPPLSDIWDMDDLLDRYYAEDKKMYDLQTKLQLARRLGYRPKPGQIIKEDVERWIADHLPDDNVSVVAIEERREGRDPGDWQ